MYMGNIFHCCFFKIILPIYISLKYGFTSPGNFPIKCSCCRLFIRCQPQITNPHCKGAENTGYQTHQRPCRSFDYQNRLLQLHLPKIFSMYLSVFFSHYAPVPDSIPNATTPCGNNLMPCTCQKSYSVNCSKDCAKVPFFSSLTNLFCLAFF